MKVFNNLKEMKPYYNEKINTYEFIENNRFIDIKIDFDLNIECNINALDIISLDIIALDIKARDINASYIEADDINALDIISLDIIAWDIKARDINAWGINSRDINSRDINAGNIKANNISFYAVCFAYKTFVCNSIKGRRENSKYFCLDSDVVIKNYN